MYECKDRSNIEVVIVVSEKLKKHTQIMLKPTHSLLHSESKIKNRTMINALS